MNWDVLPEPQPWRLWRVQTSGLVRVHAGSIESLFDAELQAPLSAAVPTSPSIPTTAKPPLPSQPLGHRHDGPPRLFDHRGPRAVVVLLVAASIASAVTSHAPKSTMVAVAAALAACAVGAGRPVYGWHGLSPSPQRVVLHCFAVGAVILTVALADHTTASEAMWRVATLILIMQSSWLAGAAFTFSVALATSTALASAWLVAHVVSLESGWEMTASALAFAAPLAVTVFAHSLITVAERWRVWNEEQRMAAADEARRDEFQRHRLLLHDQMSLLHLLADVEISPEVGAAARAQAKTAVNEIRAFIADDHRGAGAGPRSLDAIAHHVADGFADLPLDIITPLAAHGLLGPAEADAVQQALITVLHNVRNHAHAKHVTIHADHPRSTDSWELSVRDDGVGFTMDSTPTGFGLKHQVIEELQRFGIATTISSAPGQGTLVVMTHWSPRISLHT